MSYDLNQQEEIENAKIQVVNALMDLGASLASDTAPVLTKSAANEYLLHGVCRRLLLIRRCIQNVFSIFPVHRKALLNDDERYEIEINLHAFVANVNGVLDNLAWVYLLEKELENKTENGALGVGLFKKQTQVHLPSELQDYLRTKHIMRWHKLYAKDYRDALMHRIPLYIPPYQVTDNDLQSYQELQGEIRKRIVAMDFDGATELEEERDAMCNVSYVYVHSFSNPKSSPPILLHPQLIVDGRTIMEIAERVVRHIG